MSGTINLNEILKTLTPQLQDGDYVFCKIAHDDKIPISDVISTFKEAEAITIILKKEKADELHLSYDYIAAWITLTVHSSLAAVGLTAAFAQALAKENISCNVVAAYHHDHIFVVKEDAIKAINALVELQKLFLS
jgi:uncharacterized protein